MWEKVKKAGSILYIIILILIMVYTAGMHFFPDTLNKVVGYRFYTILTGSMEPTIPTNSLALVKVVPKDEKIKPGTIVTFRANRLGDEITLTHYLRKIEKDETGKDRYYTQAEGTDHFDDYTTYRKDILGTYVFHVPYLGKLGLFMKSRYAFMMFLAVGVILLFSRVFKEEAAKEESEEKDLLVRAKAEIAAASMKGGGTGKVEEVTSRFALKEVRMKKHRGSLILSGTVVNKHEEPIRNVLLKATFLNSEQEVVDLGSYTLAGPEGIEAGEQKKWSVTVAKDENICDYRIKILSCIYNS